MEKKKVVVGMSGGVDSSVAAFLLKEAGHEVIGVTMQIWQEEDFLSQEENGGCCGLTAVEDARKVAGQLGIPYYVMNFKKEFKEEVMDYFLAEYLAGRTPNPCIACNRYVKWEALLKRSLEIGADCIATGHYGTIEQLPNGRFALKASLDHGKDQTYALYSLTQCQLSHTLMPLGRHTKEQVRDIAEKIGLSVADKPDSQEICFIPDKDYGRFIAENSAKPVEPGNFVDEDGNALGTHRGIPYYTIGQRKGLGLSMGRPVFVKEIRPESNEIVISGNESLFSNRVLASHLNFMSREGLDGELRVLAKIRYNHRGAWASVRMLSEDRLECVFEEPQRAPTPGQALVLYEEGGWVLGGGTIISNKG